MRLLWLANVLRDAGLTVHEYPGWRTRGSEDWEPTRGVICHATAGSRTSTDAGETRTLWVTGSTSAPVPISQLYLSRSGEWTVGASGRCNHVLVGDKGPHKGFGNSWLVGVEAQNDNRGEPWSKHMLASYQRGVAAILRRLELPASRAAAHAEHQSGKSDPLGINMTAFRAEVARLIVEDDVTAQENWEYPLESATGKRYTAGERLLDVQADVDKLTGLPAAVAALAGQVSGLMVLVQQLATMPPVPVTPEALAELTAAVTQAAAAGAEQALEEVSIVVGES